MTKASRTSISSGLPTFRIQLITEAEVEKLVIRIGGRRAHPDADRRDKRGADFLLGNSVIELKILEDEGLDKPERQQKLAKLFREYFPTRPTIVLDRNLLDTQGQRSYDRIVEGPIKSAVSSARQQLEQSKTEHGACRTVLWVINNGNSSLTHEALVELVTRRARNDTREIDSVVVSGAYFYSDTFDSYFFWPIDCTPIHLDQRFAEFNDLRTAWHHLSGSRMTALMQGPAEATDTKGPVVDISFKLDGVTYVMPSPPMGNESQFFAHGRPRSNSTGITKCPAVATVFAGLSRHEWNQFNRRHALAVGSNTYEDWTRKELEARTESTLKPFIATPVTHEGWLRWAKKQPQSEEVSIHRYATDLFQERIQRVLRGAKEREVDSVLPSRYMLLITEVIGQDIAFDVSHLAEICTFPDGTEQVDEVWTDRNIFFEYGLAVGAAEAIARGIDCVYWQKDETYAWT